MTGRAGVKVGCSGWTIKVAGVQRYMEDRGAGEVKRTICQGGEERDSWQRNETLNSKWQH